MRRWLDWIFVGTLVALCGVLGVLQYQWIGEVSVAAGERMKSALRGNLVRLSQDFNSEIASAARTLIPTGVTDAQSAQAELERRFEQVKNSQHGAALFRRVGFAVPDGEEVKLSLLDFKTGQFQPAEWPQGWGSVGRRFDGRRGGGPMMEGPPPGEPPSGTMIETPIFENGLGGGRGAGRGFGRREIGWVVFDLNQEYVRGTLLPEVVQRHLELGDYEVAVVARASPAETIWASDPTAANIVGRADESVGLLETRMMQFLEGTRGRGGRGGGPGGGPDSGRWILYARHRAGSLDAVVANTRWRNLAVTGGVLLLLGATLWALMRFTRNAQRLAHMQMDFVAGVSHELRTPLTAIYTAGHNLRGRVAHNPAQVERYGEMIQQESGRLRDLVEQVLRFASINAGRVIQEPSPVGVERLIDETVDATRSTMQSAHCRLEKKIEAGLPEILADPMALRQALSNLLTNAVKYGAKNDPWIGISAARSDGSVEIRVADHGPGIPEDEQAQIFDAFFRGRKAVQDQLHGAGLGLNLAKKIVEAHKGSIRVESTPGQGAEFIVRIPAAPAGGMA